MEHTTSTGGRERSWLIQGIALSCIPAFAYLLAFIHEMGYLIFFGIPSEFISLSTAQFCVALTSLTALATTGFFMMNTVHKGLHTFTYKHPKLNGTVSSWSVYLVITIMVLSITQIPLKVAIVVLFIELIFLALLDLVLVPIARKINTEFDKTTPGLSEFMEKSSPLSRFERIVGVRIKTVVTGVCVTIFISALLGTFDARQKKEFVLLKTPNSSFVVIRAYGDTLLTAELLPENRIGEKIIIQKIGEGPVGEYFTNEDTGPLRRMKFGGGLYGF